jgi:hypothetical protein
MRLMILPAVVAIFSGAMANCASHMASRHFSVIVRGPAQSCTIEVEGREVTADELLLIARREAKIRRGARIGTDMAETPYRCVGGAIYTLQMAGFKDVKFVAEPRPQQK